MEFFMDGISFILKRFFYSFLSGCIVIFYIISFFYVLENTIILSDHLKIVILFISKNSNYFVFAIIAIFLSITIEGICQIGLECYLDLYDKEKIFDGKKCKDFKTCKDKIEFWKFIINKKVLEFIFINPSIFWICKYNNKETDFNPLGAFIKDSGLKHDTCLYFKCNLDYNAVYICARVIEREKKISNIYHYRDNSYIIQMLRLSILFIELITSVSGLIIFILKELGIWEFISNEKSKLFFGFIIFILIISFGVFRLLTAIARSFAKRFIREVGYTYEAMKLKLPITKNDDVTYSSPNSSVFPTKVR